MAAPSVDVVREFADRSWGDDGPTRAVEDVVNVGDKLLVEVMEIDRQNRISLKLAEEDEAPSNAPVATAGGDGEGS